MLNNSLEVASWCLAAILTYHIVHISKN